MKRVATNRGVTCLSRNMLEDGYLSTKKDHGLKTENIATTEHAL